MSNPDEINARIESAVQGRLEDLSDDLIGAVEQEIEALSLSVGMGQPCLDHKKQVADRSSAVGDRHAFMALFQEYNEEAGRQSERENALIRLVKLKYRLVSIASQYDIQLDGE